jgi:hypothetical protein
MFLWEFGLWSLDTREYLNYRRPDFRAVVHYDLILFDSGGGGGRKEGQLADGQ